jgi:hypothetical protein
MLFLSIYVLNIKNEGEAVEAGTVSCGASAPSPLKLFLFLSGSGSDFDTVSVQKIWNLAYELLFKRKTDPRKNSGMKKGRKKLSTSRLPSIVVVRMVPILRLLDPLRRAISFKPLNMKNLSLPILGLPLRFAIRRCKSWGGGRQLACSLVTANHVCL